GAWPGGGGGERRGRAGGGGGGVRRVADRARGGRGDHRHEGRRRAGRGRVAGPRARRALPAAAAPGGSAGSGGRRRSSVSTLLSEGGKGVLHRIVPGGRARYGKRHVRRVISRRVAPRARPATAWHPPRRRS